MRIGATKTEIQDDAPARKRAYVATDVHARTQMQHAAFDAWAIIAFKRTFGSGTSRMYYFSGTVYILLTATCWKECKVYALLLQLIFYVHCCVLQVYYSGTSDSGNFDMVAKNYFITQFHCLKSSNRFVPSWFIYS